jgi:hypothetical protein
VQQLKNKVKEEMQERTTRNKSCDTVLILTILEQEIQ